MEQDVARTCLRGRGTAGVTEGVTSCGRTRLFVAVHDMFEILQTAGMTVVGKTCRFPATSLKRFTRRGSLVRIQYRPPFSSTLSSLVTDCNPLSLLPFLEDRNLAPLSEFTRALND